MPSRLPPVRSGKKVPMDSIVHGVETTVIDLGLSRMNADHSDGERIHWTPLEEEIFEGEGLSTSNSELYAY